MKIDFEMKARNLVSQMTLEEKASMLRYDSPAIPRLGIPEYNWWNEAAHGVARAGTATVFPQNIGLAATFDEELIGDIAHAISIEARAKFNMQAAHGDRDIYKGLTFWSPNVNIFRDPRWGRGQETYGAVSYTHLNVLIECFGIQPSFCRNFLLNQGNHAVTAAKGEEPYL